MHTVLSPGSCSGSPGQALRTAGRLWNCSAQLLMSGCISLLCLWAPPSSPGQSVALKDHCAEEMPQWAGVSLLLYAVHPEAETMSAALQAPAALGTSILPAPLPSRSRVGPGVITERPSSP